MCFKCSESGHTVVLEHSIVFASQFRSFSPNVFPQNIVVKLDVDDLAIGDKFMVHNSVAVEDNEHEHDFGHHADLPCLLWSWRCWGFLLERLLFGLQVIAVGPSLIFNYDC